MGRVQPPLVSFCLGFNPWLLDDPSRTNKLTNRLCNPSKTCKAAAFAYVEKLLLKGSWTEASACSAEKR
ncbi:hypothetical protein J1N35_001069 [Gossypium stocksii]|uniref:Uncharacterized protein n=1 Tax=Gossypium stocksii TaxID=47602 RepID=A0A9D4AL06_9ROSI|nr:hypothetical protein J1N35_001069 [Gossypium stocksii]